MVLKCLEENKMKILMRENDAMNLVENLAYQNLTNFNGNDPSKFLRHIQNTGEIAKEIAGKLGMNSQEAALTGYFHDIGKCFTKDKKGHTFHEIIGARYVEGEGVSLGIGSQKECDRIAQSLRSHFLVHEQFKMEDTYEEWMPGIRDTNPDLLLPKSWNELVIVYADLTNSGGKRVSFEERIDNIKARDKKKITLV